jgi:hypothetical protein
MWSSPITASVPSVDQALRVRANRDFADRASYERFLQDLVRYRNQTRAARFAQDQQALRPLPAQPLAPCRELQVSVSRFSTIQVLGNTYSVPSRLIGTTLLVRIRSEHLEGYVGAKPVVTLPRLHGRAQHAINYRHLIWSPLAQTGCFCGLSLSRRPLPHPGVSSSVRPTDARTDRASGSGVCAGAASGRDPL